MILKITKKCNIPSFLEQKSAMQLFNEKEANNSNIETAIYGIILLRNLQSKKTLANAAIKVQLAKLVFGG